MRDIIKPALALLIICFVVVLSVSFVNTLTKDKIEMRIQEETLGNILLAFDEELLFKDITHEKSEVLGADASKVNSLYAGYKNEEFYGLVFDVFSEGYGGPMQFIIGIHQNGEISNIILGTNSETPKLGTKIGEEIHVQKYIGKDILNHELKLVTEEVTGLDEIDSITNATISSRGMNNAVNLSGKLAKKILESGGF